MHTKDVCTLLKQNRQRVKCSCRVVQGEGGAGRGRCRGFNGAGGIGQDLLLVMDGYRCKDREAGLQLVDESERRRKVASLGSTAAMAGRVSPLQVPSSQKDRGLVQDFIWRMKALGGENKQNVSCKLTPLQDDFIWWVKATDEEKMGEIWELLQPERQNFYQRHCSPTTADLVKITGGSSRQ